MNNGIGVIIFVLSFYVISICVNKVFDFVSDIIIKNK